MLIITSLVLNLINLLQNMEAEKQVKFFQGCVAAAFAERDHAVMEVMIGSLFCLKCGDTVCCKLAIEKKILELSRLGMKICG